MQMEELLCIISSDIQVKFAELTKPKTRDPIQQLDKLLV